jgi:orotidine-5'-phosphate decarboxylase
MPSSQIIVPIDVSTESEAIALIDKLPEVTFWKVGLELFVSTGANVVKILKERQKKVFLDLKLHDIPNTVAGASRAAARYGADLLTIHSTCGVEALTLAHEAIQQGALESGVAPTKLIAITVLTSLSSRQLAFELKIPLELPEYALNMAFPATST